MKSVFLSASVPIKGRSNFFENSDPYLIQTAVREFFISVIKNYNIVWGGHPSITPMLLAICEDIGGDCLNKVILYQSMFFDGKFPDENSRFNNVVYVDAVDNDLNKSLLEMRHKMISRADLVSAVFIGGMEGIFDEFEMFTKFHLGADVLPLGAPGGASLDLLGRISEEQKSELGGLDFRKIFTDRFSS